MTHPLKLAALIVAVCAVGIAGCATVPAVDYSCQASGAVSPADFATATRGCTQALVTSIAGARKELHTYSRLAKAGTFAGALAAGTAAMFKGHRDLIVGSALFGATSYQLGNLYAPDVFDTILLAGYSAATCVDSVALSLDTDIVDLSEQASSLDASSDRVVTLSQMHGVSAPVKQLADAAVNRAVIATTDARAKLVSTRAANARILGSASTIHTSIEQQLSANAPKLDAFQAAAASALAVGRAAVPSAAPATPARPAAAAPPSKAPDTPDSVVKEAVASLAARTQALVDATAKLGAIDTVACETKAIAATPEALTIAPTSVDLSGGQNVIVNVVVHGGQASYRGQWKGTEPASDDNIVVTQNGNAFKFTGAKKGHAFTYEISDQLGKTIDVPVKN